MKNLGVKSPLGIALAAAGVFLALSPGARKSIRNLVVKGTAGVMDAMEQVSTVASGIANQKSFTWKSGDGDHEPVAPVPPVTPVAPETLAVSEGKPPASDVQDSTIE